MAPTILRALGLRPWQGCDRLVLVDAGPWGDVWRLLAARRLPDVADQLDAFAERMSSAPTAPNDLWLALARGGRPEDAVERAAAYLWLQARAPSGVPVWWEDSAVMRLGDDVHRNGVPKGGVHLSGGHARDAEALPAGCAPLRRPTGGRNGQAMAATAPSGISGLRQGKTGGREEPAYGPKTLVRPTRNRVGPSTGARGGGSPGMVRPGTLARRLRALHDLTRDVDVVARSHHPQDGDPLLDDLDGAAVYLDPPYVGAPRYAAVCPRPEVIQLAERCRAAGARVVISEAEAILTDPWHAIDVSHEAARAGKREWLTCSHPPDPPAQLALFTGATA